LSAFVLTTQDYYHHDEHNHHHHHNVRLQLLLLPVACVFSDVGKTLG
jgi:hypothetical protein